MTWKSRRMSWQAGSHATCSQSNHPPFRKWGVCLRNVTSNPDGADVYADGQFVGNIPVVLKLKPGKHTLTVKLCGHPDWSREITVE